MRLTNAYLGVISLTGTIAAPKNDEKGLRQFGKVWWNLLWYQKVGVQPMFLIPLSCILRYHWAYFQFNWQCRILLFLNRSIQWSYWGICISYPCDVCFRNSSIFWVNVSKNARDRVYLNMSTFSTCALILGHHRTGTLISQLFITI